MPRRVNIIPLAGAGQRFIEQGYTTPKPLIDINGKPMVVRAAESLPAADLWIFVCRREHIEEFAIDQKLASFFSPCDIVIAEKLTEGQASTCLLAATKLKDDDLVTVGACDNAMRWQSQAYNQLATAGDVDFIVWTFRGNAAVLKDPGMYGWVKVNAGGAVESVSVKKPISLNPINDHAVVGAFTFRTAKMFRESIAAMIQAEGRINGEFYLDNAVNFALAMGLNGRVLNVEEYFCWGTPDELNKYLCHNKL